ncbi:putative universal stress protein [Rubripirellula tenax]|uniref:Putative universal stress protein n=1 Tax=Rubripirellula tenax TaxID=2528015 RepID=A0A5C6EE91_9BACT|nr:universal stress protein [Rubripirellula tenax]TWU47342.1 putative universal stress protein [Rubripirellula tenax]
MKVLLATDGSENAIEAAMFLKHLARKETFDVCVYTVSFVPQHPHNSAFEPWYPQWLEQERDRVTIFQNRIKTILGDSCRSISVGHGFGAPIPELLDEAKRTQADLVVVGAKGHTTLHRLLLGSTSDSIATHAECSVLVVRGRVDSEGKPFSVIGNPPKILFAYDGSKGSREAIDEQLSLNWSPATQVNVISVATAAYAFFDDTFAAMAAQFEAEQAEQTRLEAEHISGEIAAKFPSTTVEVPRANHIGDAIVSAAEANVNDLIVIGDSGHTLIGDLLLGSTSKYVLRHAPCSVWISRHHRREK